MNRYYFNFREGHSVARDRIGMYLPSLDAARELALCTCSDLALVMAQQGGELCGEVEVTDASGDPVLTIPLATCH